MNAAQPEPRPVGTGRVIFDLVKADLDSRAEVGKAKYGTLLRAGNGRNALMDAYQEVLDLAMYLRQALEEKREAQAEPVAEAQPCPDGSPMDEAEKPA